MGLGVLILILQAFQNFPANITIKGLRLKPVRFLHVLLQFVCGPKICGAWFAVRFNCIVFSLLVGGQSSLSCVH